MPCMSEAVQQAAARAGRLLEILELEQIEQNLFRANNEVRGKFRLFGGQVLAQALRAAYRTVDDRHVHSLHGYFLRAGNAAKPVLFEVDRIRDGRSFTTRRVVAIQSGDAIFNMDASFQVDEQGLEHAHPMPNVPPPEELADDLETVAGLESSDPGLTVRARPFEMRSVFEIGSDAWRANRYWNPVWIRFRLPGVRDPQLVRCLMAYASDMGMVSTAYLPHHQTTSRHELMTASLDHALWFHRPTDLEDWLLFHKRTSMAEGSRGLVHADFFTRGGELVASVSQEGLMRMRTR